MTSTLHVHRSLYRVWFWVVFSCVVLIVASIVGVSLVSCINDFVSIIIPVIVFAIVTLISVMCAGIMGFVAVFSTLLVCGTGAGLLVVCCYAGMR